MLIKVNRIVEKGSSPSDINLATYFNFRQTLIIFKAITLRFLSQKFSSFRPEFPEFNELHSNSAYLLK